MKLVLFINTSAYLGLFRFEVNDPLLEPGHFFPGVDQIGFQLLDGSGQGVLPQLEGLHVHIVVLLVFGQSVDQLILGGHVRQQPFVLLVQLGDPVLADRFLLLRPLRLLRQFRADFRLFLVGSLQL